jgi:toxin ParE1/3/4
MNDYWLSPKAVEDLWEIWRFIAVENQNPIAADRLWQDLEAACERLAKNPILGHPRKDLTLDGNKVLFYCVREYYLVVYRQGTKPLEVARILHGARDVEAEMEE